MPTRVVPVGEVYVTVVLRDVDCIVYRQYTPANLAYSLTRNSEVTREYRVHDHIRKDIDLIEIIYKRYFTYPAKNCDSSC